jgi:hypothetical protein
MTQKNSTESQGVSMNDLQRSLFDAKVGHFAVSKIVGIDEDTLRVSRVVEVYPPGVEGLMFCGRPVDALPYHCVHLGGLGLCPSRSVIRFFETEAEARLVVLEQDHKKLEEKFQEEKESHAATRAKLQTLKEMVKKV